MPIQSQVPQSPYANQGVSYANPQPAAGISTPFQTPDLPQANVNTQTPPFMTADPNPIQGNTIPEQPIQPVETPQVNPVFSNPAAFPVETNTVPQMVKPVTPQPINNNMQPNMQTTSPLDTPPAPPSQPQPIQAPVNLGSTIMEEKPKKKLPLFLIFLLFLVVIVLGAVGYLAYQNYNLNKNINKTPAQTPLSKPAAEKNPYEGYITYKSTALPIEFMVPSDWKVNETQQKDLADQKMINVDSPDFSYGEGTISKGYEFRIGPVDNLTKKYDSFDAFSAEENTGNFYSQKSINGTVWLVKSNEAKTLITNTPLTVALYSSADLAENAVEIFNKILNSVKITQTSSNTPTSTPISTSSAMPF